jgi:molybdenum cofactor synthesis domain-containing protein
MSGRAALPEVVLCLRDEGSFWRWTLVLREISLNQKFMRIEVICTGDEVLTGKIVNTNFSYISQKLEDFGLAVTWETTVGDDRADLLLAFRLAGERADAVIVNGGLGPTVDDLSQEIAARAAGVELELNELWLATMEAYFNRRSRVMPPNNRNRRCCPPAPRCSTIPSAPRAASR